MADCPIFRLTEVLKQILKVNKANLIFGCIALAGSLADRPRTSADFFFYDAFPGMYHSFSPVSFPLITNLHSHIIK